MKARIFGFVLGLALVFGLAGQSSQATTLTWDASGNAGNPSFDGSGTWSTTNNWWNLSTDVAWNTSDVAQFGATAGSGSYTVTLGQAETAAGISFANQNYTLAGGGGPYPLTIGSTGIAANVSGQISAPVILGSGQTWTVASGQTLNVSGSISGGNTLTTAGAGIVNLTGINTYTGATTVSAGTLQVGVGGVIDFFTTTSTTGITISGPSGGTATMNLSGGSVELTCSNRAIEVGNSTPGVFNMSGGTLNLFYEGGINIGQSGNGVWNQTGGLLIATSGDSNQTQIGNNSGPGQMTVSGGIYSTPLSALYVGVRSPSTLTVSGNGDVTCGTLAIGENGGSTTSGTVTLSGGTVQANSVQEQGGNTGVFNFNGGLLLAGSSALSSWIPNSTAVTYNVQNGGAFLGANGFNVTVAQPLVHYATATTDSLTVLGPGTVTLTGSNTYAGATTISAGTLAIGAGGTTGSIGATSGITDNGLLAFSRSDNYGGVFSRAISGTGGVSVSGGSLTLTGANTYSGTTSITSATLAAGAANVFSPSSAMTLNSGALNVGAFGTQTVSSFAIGGGSLDISLGSGTLASSGPFTINGGNLELLGTPSAPSYTLMTFSSTAGIGPSALNFTAPAGYSLKWVTGATDALDLVAAQAAITWSLSGGGSWNSAASWNPATIPNGDEAWAVLGSALQTSGTVTLDGPQTVGTLTFNNAAASYTLAAGSGGLLVFSNSTASAPSQLLVGAGTHSITAPVKITNGNLTVNEVAGSSLAVSGNIGDDGLSRSLTLGGDGSGMLLLSGSNTYGGGTTVSAGTLTDGGANSLGTGPLAILGGAVYTNNSQAVASVALSAGLLSIGNSAALGTGPLTISGGSLDNISGAAVTNAGNNAQTWTNSFTFVGSNPLNMGSGAVTMNASPTVTVSAGTLTEGGAISGSGTLSVAGPGVLVLTGSSSYSGGTTIHSGVLTDGGANSLGSGPLSISGGTLNTNYPQSVSSVALSAGLLTIGNSAALGAGPLTISGGSLGNVSGAPATLASNNPQTWTNSFTFVGSSPLNMGSGAVTMNVSPTITVSAGTLTEGGAISGGGALTVAGGGLLDLTGNSTYSGATIVSGGTLEIDPGGSIGYSSSATSSQISISGTSGTATMNLSGGSIQITNSNRAVLVGANSGQPGVFNMSAGTLNLYTSGGINIGNNGNGAWNQTGGLLTASNGDSNQTQLGNIAGSGQMTVSGGTFSTPLSALYVGVRSPSSLTVSGNGYVTCGTLAIGENGGSTTSGTVTLSGGTTQANSIQEQGGNTGVFNLNGGMLLPGAGPTSPWIPFSSLLTFNVQNGGAVINNNGQTVTIAQPLLQYPASTGGLSASGGGDLVLSASNTYTGPTNISSGTLGLGANGSIVQSSTIAVSSGATFDVSAQSNYHLTSGQTLTGTGNFTVNGAMTANSGSVILSPGAGLFRTVNVGNLTLSTGSVLNYDIGSPAAAGQDLINVAANLGGTGAGFYLYQGDGASQFSSTGTYELMSYGGAATLPTGALSVLNANPSDFYVFSETGGSLNLTISPLNYWTGGSNGPFTWSNAANWSSHSPVNGQPLLFTGSVGLSNTNDIANLHVAGIAFDATAGAFNISGNSIQFNGAISNSSTAAQTIGLNVGLLESAVVNAAAGNIVMNGIISDGGAGYGLITTGFGTVVLAAANTYSGTTNIGAGTLSLAHPLAAQNSTVNLGGGGLNFAAGVTSPTLGGLSGSGNVALATTASEPVTLNVGGNGQSTTYSGILSGAGGLVKQGAGALTLTGSQTYGGATLVSGGVLQLRSQADLGSAGISVHFLAGGSSVSGPAGVIPLSNWVNLAGASFTNQPLTDSSSAATTATLTANAAGSSQSGSSNPVLNGYIVNGNFYPLSATLSGIPYLQYNIYAYMVDSSAGYGEKLTAGGTTFYFSPNNSAAYSQITSITPGSYQTGNYVLLSGLSGASQTLTVQGVSTQYGSFAGFEIVNTATGNWNVLPATTPVTISSGGTLDMTNQAQVIASLSSTDGQESQVLLGSGMLTITGPAVTTFDGVISGTGGSLTSQGGGLTLTGSNTYSGATTISGGSLQLGNGQSGQDGSIANTTGVTDNGALIYNLYGSRSPVYAISGSGSVAVSGPGFLNLSASNGYSGGTQIQAGTLQIGNVAALGTGALAANGGTLDLNGFGITVPSFSGAVSGSGSAGGVATDTSNGGVTAFTVNQSTSTTFGGSFQEGPNGAKVGLYLQNSGQLTLTGNNAVSSVNLQDTSTLVITGTVSAGAFNVNYGSPGGARLAGSGSIVLGDTGLFYDSTAASNFAGDISGAAAGGLEVDSGTLTLSGTNTYGGGTVVDDTGTLILDNSEALPAGSSLIVGDAMLFSGVLPAAAPVAAASIAPVPEPGTLVLLLAGLWSAMAYCRVRRRN